MIDSRDDSMVRFWQRNRPGDCEELIASNFVPFKSEMLSEWMIVIVPRNGYYATTKESFSISRDIPSLGKIEDGIELLKIMNRSYYYYQYTCTC